MSFNFNSVDLDSFLDQPRVRDGVESITNGKLPGVLGLGQAIVETWSKPRHDTWRPIWATRNSVQTAALLYNYRNAGRPRKKMQSPFEKFINDNDLVNVPILEHISNFILIYAKQSEVHGTTDVKIETSKLQSESSAEINTLTLPSPDLGSPVKVIVGSVSHGKGSNEHSETDGPYVDKNENPDRVRLAISAMIWKHMGGSVQLIATPRFGDSFSFTLEPLPMPGDYVDRKIDGVDEIGLSLERLGNRCRSFMKAKITRRVLLHGPPGTGKSTLAHRLASSMGNRVLRVDPRAFAKASQKNLTALVNVLRPNVFLLDDIDRRPGDAVELLSYFDDLKLDVIVVGTVNTLETLDPALLRPGRFDEVLHITEPPRAHRFQIIRHYCAKYNVPFKNALVKEMSGFSPADIQEVIRVASVVGVDVMDVEIERVRNQRRLYAGNACGKFLTKGIGKHDVMDIKMIENGDEGSDDRPSIGDNPACPPHTDCDSCPHSDYCL